MYVTVVYILGAIIHMMCVLIVEGLYEPENGGSITSNNSKQSWVRNETLEQDVLRIFGKPYTPYGETVVRWTAEYLCSKVLYTIYIATEHSSAATKYRASTLAQQMVRA